MGNDLLRHSNDSRGTGSHALAADAGMEQPGSAARGDRGDQPASVRPARRGSEMHRALGVDGRRVRRQRHLAVAVANQRAGASVGGRVPGPQGLGVCGEGRVPAQLGWDAVVFGLGGVEREMRTEVAAA